MTKYSGKLDHRYENELIEINRLINTGLVFGTVVGAAVGCSIGHMTGANEQCWYGPMAVGSVFGGAAGWSGGLLYGLWKYGSRS